MKYDIPLGAQRILHTLTDAGFEACLVGGCVRDLLGGIEPHDWDICTSALPGQAEACFPGHRIMKTGLKHGTLTVMADGGAFEVTTYRIDGQYTDGRRPDSVAFVPDLKEDLARRDFTMNAIAMGLDGVPRDPFGGGADIRARLVRCVGDPDRRFQEDGLRIMRALRFASVFGYAVEAQTAGAIHRNRAMLKHVAAERINAELCKLLCGSGAGPVLRQFPDVLCEFWPDLGPLVNLGQNNPWHCWGGWEHTVHAIDAAPAELIVRLAVLLHDAGKPAAKTAGGRGVGRFHGRPAAGGEIAGRMLSQLKFDRGTSGRVATLVRNYGAPIEPRDRAIRRLLNKLGPEGFFMLLDVRRADSMGQGHEKAKDRLARLDEAGEMAGRIIASRQCFSLRELAVTGRDVLGAGVKAGPEVGRILNALLDQVIDGQLPNDHGILLRAIQRLKKE